MDLCGIPLLSPQFGIDSAPEDQPAQGWEGKKRHFFIYHFPIYGFFLVGGCCFDFTQLISSDVQHGCNTWEEIYERPWKLIKPSRRLTQRLVLFWPRLCVCCCWDSLWYIKQMPPPNIWDAWYILGTAVLQSITEAVVNKVVRSWLNPLGKISPGGLRTSRRCKVNATRSPVHTATLSPPRHPTFSGCVHSFTSLLPPLRQQLPLSTQMGPCVEKRL